MLPVFADLPEVNSSNQVDASFTNIPDRTHKRLIFRWHEFHQVYIANIDSQACIHTKWKQYEDHLIKRGGSHKHGV